MEDLVLLALQAEKAQEWALRQAAPAHHGAGLKLDELGIEWKGSRQVQSWDESFTELEAFYNTNGHCKVAKKTEGRLYDWLFSQKKRGRGSRKPELTKEQIEKLTGVGVTW